MVDAIFIAIWMGISIYWIYVHFKFYKELKSKEPEMYKANSGWSPLKYSTSFAYIDFALSGGHKRSLHATVISSGNRLVKAYDAKFKIIGFGLGLSSLWFAASLTFQALNAGT